MYRLGPTKMYILWRALHPRLDAWKAMRVNKGFVKVGLERLSQLFLPTLTFRPSMIFMTFSVVKDGSNSNLTRPTFCDIR
jgi:hypothetical protein